MADRPPLHPLLLNQINANPNNFRVLNQEALIDIIDSMFNQHAKAGNKQ